MEHVTHCSDGNVQSEILPFPPSDRSSQSECVKPAVFPTKVIGGGAVGTVLHNQVVFCTTEVSGIRGQCYKYRSDGNRSTWDMFPGMSSGRKHAASVMLNFNGTQLWWVLGGQGWGGKIHSGTEIYNCDINEWILGPNMTMPLYMHCAVQLDKFHTMVIGGNN